MTVSSPNFIFITGGVVSGLGKGIAAASLAALLKALGYKVKIRKLDPYLNQDPGTMSPYQHGEVFVTDDGCETDLDLGHYERFTGISCTKNDSVTSGKIYSNVFAKERKGVYLGATIQVVPHIIDEIKAFVLNETQDLDFVICEIGGTVGDIEGLPFLEAIRQLRNQLGTKRTLFLHTTLVPYISAAKELKTKPTQHSVKELLSYGIQPDVLLCRATEKLSNEIKSKIALFCNVDPRRVISAPDVAHIYQVPLVYFEEGLSREICSYFELEEKQPDLTQWLHTKDQLEQKTKDVTIGIVGKYSKLPDAYKSILEALTHAGLENKARVNVKLIEATEDFDPKESLKECEGVIVPGGFGFRGIEAKLKAITYARENKIPFLGICLGMQLTIIEAARNLLGLKEANSTEFGPTPDPVIGLMTEWIQGQQVHQRDLSTDLGGTMRLGAYPCVLKDHSLAKNVYKNKEISERHRHRFEVNFNYKSDLESVGLVFSGLSPDGKLTEIIEREDHPYFIAVQFHPEFKSRPFAPHPLFKELITKALEVKG